MMKIAVTGGLASGKSTVCQTLRSLGAYVVSADDIVHHLLNQPSNIKEISRLCEAKVISDGQLNKQQVANCVFSDPLKLKEIEQLLHPQVFEEIKKQYNAMTQQHTYAAFVVEVPLLFEAGWQDYFDKTIALSAPKAFRQKRFIEAGGSLEDFHQREERLYSDEQRANQADIVLNNVGSIEDLTLQINQITNNLFV